VENGMAQLHFYLPDAVADKIKAKAEQAHLSVSKYLAELAKREIDNQWPDGYFDNFGKWQGDAAERPEQGVAEQRASFD
jgi:hypothetical protein